MKDEFYLILSLFSRRNIPNFKDDSYLKHCTYHAVNDPLCPIFVLGDMVSGDYDEIAVKVSFIMLFMYYNFM